MPEPEESPASVLPVAAAPPQEAPVPASSPAASSSEPPKVDQAIEQPKAEDKAPELTADKPTLLETLDKEKPEEEKKEDPKEAEKPAEAKPEEKKDDPKSEAKPGEPEKAAEPVKTEAPVEYKFQLPEALRADEEKMGEFTGILNEVKAPAEVGQKLIDLHSKAMTAYAEHVSKEQHRAFNETRDSWRKEILADPVLGGAGYETAMGAVARMRDMLVPKEIMESRKWPDGTARLSKLEEFLRVTGAGDHPVFHHILHTAAKYFDEPSMPPSNINPPPNNGRDPRARGKGVLYDHPRSNPNGRQ